MFSKIPHFIPQENDACHVDLFLKEIVNQDSKFLNHF